jgi:hypothetical protein
MVLKNVLTNRNLTVVNRAVDSFSSILNETFDAYRKFALPINS